MSWYATVALTAVLSALLVAVLVVVVSLLNRGFAVLGSIVDRWRPTPAGQARPGHHNLGVGGVMVATPVAACLWYDLGLSIAARPATLPDVEPIAVLALVIVMIVTPASGIWALLGWKNTRLEFSGDKIRQTTALAREYDWQRVTGAAMQPPFRGPGRIYFDLADRSIAAATDWINIREAYEGLGERACG